MFVFQLVGDYLFDMMERVLKLKRIYVPVSVSFCTTHPIVIYTIYLHHASFICLLQIHVHVNTIIAVTLCQSMSRERE